MHNRAIALCVQFVCLGGVRRKCSKDLNYRRRFKITVVANVNDFSPEALFVRIYVPFSIPLINRYKHNGALLELVFAKQI